MKYTLHQLEIFLRLSRTLSVTQAAEELNLSQPAVSIQLKNFQAHFPLPLTEIVHKRLYLTEFGRSVAKKAEEVIRSTQGVNQCLADYQGEISGNLRISTVSTGKYLAPYLIAPFANANPSVDICLSVSNKTQVMTELASNEVDLALISLKPDMRLAEFPIMDNEFVLVGANPPVSGEVWSPDRLASISLLFREPGSATRQMMERYIQQHGLNVKMRLELSSNEAIKQSILAGLGYSIMPKVSVLSDLEQRNLFIQPVRGLPIRSYWSFVWPEGKKLSPQAQEFLDTVKTNLHHHLVRFQSKRVSSAKS
ncbi:MAG: LysR family transcriptional regulator [Bacteroidota bacterium]